MPDIHVSPHRIPLGSLSVPVHLIMVRPTVQFTSQISHLLGFSKTDSQLLGMAVEEAFGNAIRHFSGPVEGEAIDVEFCVHENSLVISIRERGIPFTPQQGQRYTPDDLENMDMPGLGTLLMQKAVDSLEFLSHGRKGKETRLIKTIPYGALPQELLEVQPVRRGRDRPTVKNAIVRPATREELPHICQLAWRCYGYTQEAFLYDLEALTEAFDKGTFVPVVAIDPASNQMVWHAGLKIHDPNVPVGEMGLAFIDPAFRCPGATQQMADAVTAMAKKAGHRGTFDCSVTTHTFSQKAMQNCYGSRPCSIMLAITASGMHAKELATSVQPKGSVVNHYRAFDRSPATVYVPERHRTMVSNIYGWLELPREIGTPDTEYPLGESRVSVFPLPDELNVVFIIVHAIGPDTAKEIAEALRQCKRERRDAVYAFLPLGAPASPMLVEECEALGLSFAGVMPHIHDGDDRMLMQRVDIVLDMDTIRVYGEQSKQLFDYIQREQQRVDQGV
ncbi:ATP-binding protein [Desulfovibrio ferrophilus]|uniref:N-acetyltransferase domain-containing protein n=1 Tax=Desulfovibrio ferrophilus TaxID=241368 RepID=A0A2Z6B160_9BACT|nr:ATP-binding protein [Desulfovibrio ferrophilus]BBD09160.1 uncharacterized protein DFE_2434 [Desulfovibrio ferrophilus]